MIIVGLTGGIGMGKSTVAAAFRRARVPVFDADAAVHDLQRAGGAALPAIDAAFPGTVGRRADGKRVLDRAALRARVVGDEVAIRRLEAIMHPRVRAAEQRFLARARRAGAAAAVLDIPLLLETNGRARVDRLVVVSAPREVQMRRVLLRGRMSRAQAEAIIARQMPDREKRRRATDVVQTGLSRHYALRRVRRLIREILSGGGTRRGKR